MYIKRHETIEAFEGFLKQDELCVFALVGESGVGKTNTLINFLEEIPEYPSLFYSGTLLVRSFFEELKFDFNLEFSTQETELTLLKKISSLSESHSKSFIIYFDALDEWVASDRVKQIDSLIKVLRRYNIKICISCKDLMWGSFLVQNGIPTILSKNLFPVYHLKNFNSLEFEKAIKRYSEILQIEVNEKDFPSDLYNPFGLRISCEVSFTKNIPLEASRNSRETIENFISQKLEKTNAPETYKRYLKEICQTLLEQDQVHVDEDFIRRKLGLGINDDLPSELFASNFLYRSIVSESHSTYVGFYFSKIRDHIIAIDLLGLDNETDNGRIKKITYYLNSYIGENAINYFFKTGTQTERFDCLCAFIKYDIRNNKSILTKLLAQKETKLFKDLSNESFQEILNHIKHILTHKINDQIIGKEIIETLRKVSAFENTENFLIEVITILNEYSQNGYDISPDICGLLQKYNSEEATQRLVQILRDRGFESRIRRFVTNSLDHRTFDNKKEVFLDLLTEEEETDAGVFFYLKHWYIDIESKELRDHLLELFDHSTSEHLKDLIVNTLGFSQLEDTAEKLFERFVKNDYSEHITCWLCRTICKQDYKPAIPRFIELFKDNPSSSLADHILIGLGEIRAKELMPALFEIIRDLDEEVDIWWLSSSFVQIAQETDYEKLIVISNKSNNSRTIYFTALTLAQTRKRKFNDIILKAINDDRLEIKNRSTIFSQWSDSLTSTQCQGWYSKVDIIYSTGDNLTSDEIQVIYSIFEENSDMSIIALAILINFEPNIQRLSDKIRDVLPKLEFEFDTTRVGITLINADNIQKLAIELNPWLRKQLISSKWKNKIFLYNCIQFAGIFGDFTVLESIKTNRHNITKTLKYGEEYIQYIEHRIRTSENKIRFRLEW